MTDELDQRVRTLNAERARHVPEMPGRPAVPLSTDEALHRLLATLERLTTTPPEHPWDPVLADMLRRPGEDPLTPPSQRGAA